MTMSSKKFARGLQVTSGKLTRGWPHTVSKAVWKIFKPINFPSRQGDSASSLLGNFFSATSKEQLPLAFGEISLP